ncbi:bacteriocin-like protein [Chryseobacterium paridis]|uniref:Bacteriocin n=1 Tax=Chryseobacterium paridis TaxID=2800328 RepID=A0ABS1FR94_9FLAO|nr:hypothetical protein [Chryseobacterium paridis]MBK1894955.1 hypothetical protein [Chryseobacterium paridis]
MKNLTKLNRENLKKVLGGHTCPSGTRHIIYNGYHGCCLSAPSGNPCTSGMCFVEADMCSEEPT